MDTSRTPWPMIGLLWATGLLAAAQFAKLTLMLDAMAAAYPDAPVALAVSGPSVVGILAGAVAGYFVARIGARKAVLGAVAMSAVVSLIQSLDMPFGLFMVTRVFEGAGHLLLVVALPTMMAALAKPEDRSVVMGLWGTFFGVGYAILALIEPGLLALGGMPLVHVMHGLVFACLFPVLLRLMPSVMSGGAPMPRLLPLHKAIYSTPRYFAPGVGHGIYTSLFIALVAFLPAELEAMWLTPVLPLANLSGTFASGFVARRIRASRLSIIGFGTGAILFALMAMTGSVALALAAMVFTGLTAGANFAAVPELNATPQDQARANGAMAQLGNVGTFSGTPLFALMAGSLWGVAGLSIAICLAGVMLAGLAYRRAWMSAEMG